jgi:uncharacterized membrane protein YsdA (DUF1294 family)/cold shock CspA family protein
MLKGRITDWNRERGFGYLESEGRSVFLHLREFSERHKQPELGDQITFVMGADKLGRPCAREARHVNDGGRFRVGHFALLAALLVLPGFACLHSLGVTGLIYASSWMAVVSGSTYLVYFLDKRKAREKAWREPEHQLHLLELIGGWPGAFLAQRKLRHKATKGPYQFVFVLIIGLYQFLAIDALRGWPFAKMVATAVWASK